MVGGVMTDGGLAHLDALQGGVEEKVPALVKDWREMGVSP